MAVPLLATKLYIPPVRPGLVSRPRLIERLNAGLHRKLTLVSAPAGFGKTTLLSEWIDAGVGSREYAVGKQHEPAGEVSPTPYSILPTPIFAWLSLDEGDNDPARFLAYLIAALQQIAGGIGQGVLGALQSPRLADANALPPVEELLAALINQIHAIPDDFVLVLNDYHLITAQPIHDALTFLLDHLPPQMHLVIATRSDPPWHLARLRGQGQLTELRQADLRFTPDEATAFLNQVMGLGLTGEDVAALEKRTEGWITGLQLAAISMQGREDSAGFVQAFTGSNRFILDYLVEEVLERQPPAIQEFLLKTSILDRLIGPLCDAVLGISESANQRISESTSQRAGDLPICRFADLSGKEILDYLERNNLFVVPLDDERRWYRYHRLFADLLRKRLYQAASRAVEPDLVPTLHRRASAWYEQHGLMAAAIDHALAAGDAERAAHLIEQLAEILWGEGAHITLLRWLEALPDGLVCARPRLCIYHALMLSMAGRLDAAELRLQAAERVSGATTGGAEGEQGGMVAATRALIAYFQGDAPAIVQFSRQALEALPEGNSTWRSSAAIALGDAHRWSGDMMAADRAYEEALKVGRATGNVFLMLVAGIKRAFVQSHQGRMQRAVEICQQQLQLLDESGMSQTPMVAGVFTTLGTILCERNDLDEALHYVQRACELSEQGNSVGMLGLSHLVLLKILLSRREPVGVEETLQKLEKLARESEVPIWIASGVAALKVQLWVAEGKLEPAARLLQERGLDPSTVSARGKGVADDLVYPREIEYLALARLLIAQGKPGEAAALLERLLQAAEAGGRVGWTIATLVLRALALQARGDVDQAMTPLARALALAEPEGYVRVFVDEGPAMAELLRDAASRGIAPGYASRLLAAFDVSEYATHTSAQPLIEPLSERELEVLRFLTTHLSSTEIAKELVIAPSTVRSHVKSIYGKLNVHGRKNAVQRAGELGLL